MSLCLYKRPKGTKNDSPTQGSQGYLRPPAGAGLSCRDYFKVWGEEPALLCCRGNSTLAGMLAPLGSIPTHRIAPLGWEGAVNFSQQAGEAPPLAVVPASSHRTLICSFILPGSASHHPTLLETRLSLQENLVPCWETPAPRKHGQSQQSELWQESWSGFCPSTGAAPGGAKLLCHPQHHPACLCSSSQMGKMLSRCRCRCHTSPLSISGWPCQLLLPWVPQVQSAVTPRVEVLLSSSSLSGIWALLLCWMYSVFLFLVK